MKTSIERLWSFLEANVFDQPSSSEGEAPFFNPYCTVDEACDLPEADRIRRDNLSAYFQSIPGDPRILVLGEAPGWRGCRFSGVPFTSEALLVGGDLPFAGKQSSLRKVPYSEATATLFWKGMSFLPFPFLAWNCVPVHPHQPGKPLSNRRPSRDELKRFGMILAGVIGILRPDRIIAVGRTAENVLLDFELRPFTLRHPSHGGARKFVQGISQLLASF